MKKLLLSILILTSMSLYAQCDEDLNGDGIANVVDIVSMVNFILGGEDCVDDCITDTCGTCDDDPLNNCELVIEGYWFQESWTTYNSNGEQTQNNEDIYSDWSQIYHFGSDGEVNHWDGISNPSGTIANYTLSEHITDWNINYNIDEVDENADFLIDDNDGYMILDYTDNWWSVIVCPMRYRLKIIDDYTIKLITNKAEYCDGGQYYNMYDFSDGFAVQTFKRVDTCLEATLGSR